MGKFGIGEINNNDNRLMEFCSTNNFIIGGTLFNNLGYLHGDMDSSWWQVKM